MTIGSTVAVTGAGYHENAIIEAVYQEPPASSPLPFDGVIQPTSAPTLGDLRPQLATWST